MEKERSGIEPGSLLGRYRIEGSLGSGGMGAVFRARDLALGREVAVKVLSREARNHPGLRQRLETEARVVAALTHPGIVPVYDVGETDGVPFIVQELVEGVTVEQVLANRGAVDADQAAEWAAQAADALAAAHEHGILHRDVKPGNLLISKDGRLRVFDFGLAKVLEHRRHGFVDGPPTDQGMVVGSVEYISPEQAEGKTIDGRSDLFSLGVVLYEMVAGRRPFDRGTRIETMAAIVCQPAPPIEETAGTLPEAFLAILESCLEKDPENRCQSMKELASELRRFLRRTRGIPGVPPLVRSAEPRPVPVPADRRLRIGAAVAAGVLLGVIGTAGAMYGYRLSHPIYSPISDTLLLQTGHRFVEPAFSPDGKAFAYSSNLEGRFDVYLRQLGAESSVRLTDLSGDCRRPVFSPAGDAIYFTLEPGLSGTPSVWSVPVAGGTQRRIVERAEQPHLSADGRQMLFVRRAGSETALLVASPDGTNERKLLDGGPRRIEGPRFSRSGDWVYFLWHDSFTGHRGDVWKVPAGGGEPVRLTNANRGVWGHVEVLPDDRGVLYSTVDQGKFQLWKVAAQGGEPAPVLHQTARLVWPAVSPDGARLIVQARALRSDAWEFSLPSGEARRLTYAERIHSPVRLSDGRLLHELVGKKPGERWIAIEADRRNSAILATGCDPRPSPDERRIYHAMPAEDGRQVIAVADVAGGASLRLTRPEGTDGDPCPTPDEKGVVFSRTWPGGRQSLELLDRGKGTLTTLFEGDAETPAVTATLVLFGSCTPPEGCGIYSVPLSGGTPRMVVPGGRSPALAPDGKTLYAWVGREWEAHAVSAPVDGTTSPRRLFDFTIPRDGPSWAVGTLSVSPDGKSLIVGRHNVVDMVLLMEGDGVLP